MPEPSGTNSGRHADGGRGLVCRDAFGYLDPELALDFTPM
jgi:hypothetical protein